jgi:hypothetical protein
MKNRRVWVAAAITLACAIVSGCQSWRQLNENTLGQGSSVASLLEKLAIQNLVLFHINPHAIPSQVNINGGTVTTVNQASISANDPLNKGVTTAVAAATTVTTSLASHVASPSVYNQQNQNWTIETVTAPDKLDRLTALYRYVTVPGADLCREYPEVRVAAGTPADGAGNDPGAADAADTAGWNAATGGDAVDSYEAYKAAFPKGRHIDAANLREAQIRKAPPAGDADENDWAAALKSDSAPSYANYLRSHKNGIYAAAALDRVKAFIAAAVPKTKKLSPAFVPDESLLTEPDCIKCSRKANLGNSSALGPAGRINYCPGSRDIYINLRLIYNRWLVIVPAGTAVPDMTLIGSADGFDAYTENPAFWRQFVLAVQQAMETGSGVVAGKPNPAGPKSKATTTFVLPAQAVPSLQ